MKEGSFFPSRNMWIASIRRVDRLAQLFQKNLSRNFPRTEPDEVVCFHLAIDEKDIVLLERIHKCHECHLGSVAHTTEHGLPEKGTAQPDTVETSDEFTVLP